jgi:hypothetical protein
MMRSLDSLRADGIIPPADFIKCDVEGFEKEVFGGARALLRGGLAVECESNFGISPGYPKSHIGEVQNLLLPAGLFVFDLSVSRICAE